MTTSCECYHYGLAHGNHLLKSLLSCPIAHMVFFLPWMTLALVLNPLSLSPIDLTVPLELFAVGPHLQRQWDHTRLSPQLGAVPLPSGCGVGVSQPSPPPPGSVCPR